MFYREPVMWPRILLEDLRITLEDREKNHTCTGNCGHFIDDKSDEFTVNSYYQFVLTKGRIERLPEVLPESEPDTTGWTEANIRQALLIEGSHLT